MANRNFCWVCALACGAVALWAFKRRDPMHFVAGTTVKTENITAVKEYNRANGRMWTVYAAFIAAAGVVSLFHVIAAAIMLGVI